MEQTDLTVIVLNWNTRDLLRDCLDSVLRDPASGSWQVLVVDNASSDGSAAMVRERFPEVELLTSVANVGFARANNRALGLARGRAAVLLNSDTVVLDRALSRLLAYLERHPAVGAVGPALVLPDGSLPVVNAGHQPTIGRMLAHALALPQLLPPRLAPRGIHLPSDGRAEPREVEWLSGACLMVRREAIAEVGPLSERWFMYAEDMEWCDRIGQGGWRLVYLPEHRVVHYGGASLKQGPGELSTLWARSFFAHYARRCGASRRARAAFGAVFASGWLLRAGFNALRAGAPGARDRRARLARSGAALRYAGVGLAFALSGRAETNAERGARNAEQGTVTGGAAAPGAGSRHSAFDQPGAPVTILFVHASDELYGSDLTLLNLVRALDRRRFRPIVVLPTDLPYEGLLSNELRTIGVDCRKLDLAVIRRRYLNPGGGWRFTVRLARSTGQLVGLIRRERVALVHTNTVVVWGGALAALLTRRRHVWQLHELLTGPALPRRLFGRALLALAAVLIFNARAPRAALFGKRPNERRVRVIYNGVALPAGPDPAARDRLRAGWGVGPDDVVVAAVGRVSRRKGQRELLLAAEAVVAAAPRTHVVIVGGPVPGQEGLVEALRERAAAPGLAGRVTFTGFRDDVAAVLEAVDLVAMPALLPESFPLAVTEAMAHGRPVVASRLGGLAELIDDDETGLLVPPGDVAALAAAILRLVRDPDLRARLGRAGQTQVASRYGLDRYAAAMVRLYDEVLAPPG